MEVKTIVQKNHPKSSILGRVVAFWSLKAEEVYFEKIDVKVFLATFEKKLPPLYNYWWINSGFVVVFDADQHPEVRLAGKDCCFSLICKESKNFSWTS